MTYKPKNDEKVLAVAKAKAVEMGYELEKHKFVIRDDKNYWLVVVVPKENQLGGGAEIWVDKVNLAVVKVQRTQ